MKEYERNAMEYAKSNFDIKENVLMYKSFIENPYDNNLYDPLDIISDYLYKLGIVEKDLINSLKF